MCGRFTFQPTEAFYGRFQIINRLDSLVPRYNIAPGQMVPVIISQSPNQGMLMRWGFNPSLGQGRKNRPQDDQRSRRNARPKTGLPQLAGRELLSGPRERLL